MGNWVRSRAGLTYRSLRVNWGLVCTRRHLRRGKRAHSGESQMECKGGRMSMPRWPKLLLSGFGLTAEILLRPLGTNTKAIPAFSRQYGTSCTTCHIDFPKLNDFGKAFKDAGFKFPKNDEDFIKIPAVMLGAPAQKEMWPKHAIYPGTIPGIPQIGLRFNTFFQVYGNNRN